MRYNHKMLKLAIPLLFIVLLIIALLFNMDALNAAGGEGGDDGNGGNGTGYAFFDSESEEATIGGDQAAGKNLVYHSTGYLFNIETEQGFTGVYVAVDDSGRNSEFEGETVHVKHTVNFSTPEATQAIKDLFKSQAKPQLDPTVIDKFFSEANMINYGAVYEIVDITGGRPGTVYSGTGQYQPDSPSYVIWDSTVSGSQSAFPEFPDFGPGWDAAKVSKGYSANFTGNKPDMLKLYGSKEITPVELPKIELDFDILLDDTPHTDETVVLPESPLKPGENDTPDPRLPITYNLKLVPKPETLASITAALTSGQIASVEWIKNGVYIDPPSSIPADPLTPTVQTGSDITPQIVTDGPYKATFNYDLVGKDSTGKIVAKTPSRTGGGGTGHFIVVELEKDPAPTPPPIIPVDTENTMTFKIPKDYLTKAFDTNNPDEGSNANQTLPSQDDKATAVVPEIPTENSDTGAEVTSLPHTDTCEYVYYEWDDDEEDWVEEDDEHDWTVEFEKWTGPLTASYTAEVDPGGTLENETPATFSGEYKNFVGKIEGLSVEEEATEVEFTDIVYYWLSHRHGAELDNPTLALYMAKNTEYGGTASELDNSKIKPFLDKYGLTYEEKKVQPAKDSNQPGQFPVKLTLTSVEEDVGRPWITDEYECTTHKDEDPDPDNGMKHGPFEGTQPPDYTIGTITENLNVIVEGRELATPVTADAPVYKATTNWANRSVTYLASPPQPIKFYPTTQLKADTTEEDPASPTEQSLWILGNKERTYTPIDYFEVRLEGASPPLEFIDAPFSRDQQDQSSSIPVLKAGYYFQVSSKTPLKLVATSVVHIQDQVYFEPSVASFNATALGEHAKFVAQVMDKSRSHVVTNMDGNYEANASGQPLVPQSINGFRAVTRISDSSYRNKSYITKEVFNAAPTPLTAVAPGSIDLSRTNTQINRLTVTTPSYVSPSDPDIQKALTVNQAMSRLNKQLQSYNNSREEFGGIVLVKQQTECVIEQFKTGKTTTYLELEDNPSGYEIRYYWGTGTDGVEPPMVLYGTTIQEPGQILSDPIKMAIRGSLYDDRNNQGTPDTP